MLCPSCGEDNPQTYHFCGMCGTLLQVKANALTANLSGARRPLPTANHEAAHEHRPEAQTPPPIPEFHPRPEAPSPGIAGPSLLGLDESNPAPSSEQDVYEPFRRTQDVLEPSDPVTRRRRILALVALLLALGAAARWSYYSYVRVTGGSTGATASTQPKPASSPATTPSQPDAAAAPANPQPPAAAQASPPPAVVPAETQPAPAKPTPAPAKHETIAKADAPSTPAMRVTAKRQTAAPAKGSAADSVVAANQPAPDAGGDADYRKGEAYLYGHGVAADCEQAMKFLKSASTKHSAKARSTFGTMYATGHCVPRDLPTSYEWFALALQVDPNNQILEKDLNAIWNQMTPPERELATKSKQ